MNEEITRRDCLIGTAVLGLSVLSGGAIDAASAKERAKTKPMPTIKLGDLRVSRMILGSNPFFGFAHQPGSVGDEMSAYFTDERIVSTLDDAASHGITTVAAPPYERWIALWKSYRSSGGKLKHWIAQPDNPPESMPDAIHASVEGGASAIFIQGQRVDSQFKDGEFGSAPDWIHLIKKAKFPAGIGSHRPDTHLRAQELKLPVDFYYQCFYRNDEFKAEDRDRAVETVAKLEKPVIGYKILAAGRNAPEEGFAFAFRHLKAKDGVCVGVYPHDKAGMIAENAALVRRFTA